MKKDWEIIATNSYLQTLSEIKKTLEEADFEEAKKGLDELITIMSKADQRALLSHLVRLMAHIIKWKIQLYKRSRSCLLTIDSARFEIADIQEELPSLNDNFMEGIWQKAFERAKKLALIETGIKDVNIEPLTPFEVFNQEYTFEE